MVQPNKPLLVEDHLYFAWVNILIISLMLNNSPNYLFTRVVKEAHFRYSKLDNQDTEVSIDCNNKANSTKSYHMRMVTSCSSYVQIISYMVISFAFDCKLNYNSY